MTDSYDSPWKDALHEFLRPFLDFFFPFVEEVVDWNQQVSFLDTELRKTERDAEVGLREPDVLARVRLLDGQEGWLFIHVEVQFLDGALREVPAREGVETLDLPPPWGTTTFMYSQHSEPLTVPFAKGIAEKGIREFTWRLALPAHDHVAWEALVRAGFGDFDTPVTVPGGTVKPLDVLQAVMDRHQAARHLDIPAQDSHEIHFAIGVGQRGGHATRVTARVIGHPNELYEGYADAATSMNLSIGVQLLLGGKPVPGVWAPEEIFVPEDFLSEVRKRRFEVSIETVTLEAF